MLRVEVKKWVFETEIRIVLCLVIMALLEREECVFSMKHQLSMAWGQFLSQFSWDWFLTLTFRDPVKSFRAHRLFGYFVRDIECAANQPIIWFRADEIGSQGGRFHMHALMGNVAHLRRMFWIDRWGDLAGYARILPFTSQKGAAFYCAKYVAKELSDWELSESLLAFRENQPILPLYGPTKAPASSPAQHLKIENKPQVNHPKRQKPFPFMWDGDSTMRNSQISEAYRSEVARGGGRFRVFFPPPDFNRKQ
jgi:hypothetical protein